MSLHELVFRGRRLTSDRAMVMAIINRTPDSFYDHGAIWAEDLARTAIKTAVEEQAEVLDFGGVPASPGPEVTVAEEISRVVPTLQWARETYPDLVISVDTWRAEAAAAFCEAGADLINDSWGAAEPEILDVAAQFGAGYVCSHTDGLAPRTDPVRPQYDDVVASVLRDCTALAERALEKGVPREGIMIDPCIDFSKNTYQSLEVLRNVDKLVATGWPVLMAMSNKGVVGETLDVEMDDRLIGTLAATALAARDGAAMFRAHQPRETRQVCEMVASIEGSRPPAAARRWI
ncbi:dihydropteroate synthase [Mangrovactinospora gilvigrisea]|uniref:Dihydropteroate synthase n=1 Tax=Mangrovactinospora gilvigrisea TaxID=1428644 RepID=A0A1J7C904_9ACTN|nr:dihydropteroate synthase [Mangrovactinospora gilvigrisea]OIV38012.1 dihydropteroate synthase [Mangrovactinospora gilvigrisea]